MNMCLILACVTYAGISVIIYHVKTVFHGVNSMTGMTKQPVLQTNLPGIVSTLD